MGLKVLFPPQNVPNHTILDVYGDIALLAAGIAIVMFLLAYLTLSNWRATGGGRAVAGLVSSMVLVFVFFILSRALGGDYQYRDVIRLGVYLFVFAMSLRLLVNLIMTQLRGNVPKVLSLRKKRKLTKSSAEEGARAHSQDRETAER